MHRTIAVAALGFAVAMAGGMASPKASADGQSYLIARSRLPAGTHHAGSPPSGAFLSAAERTTATANGVKGNVSGPYFGEQPVQGFSSMVPSDDGTWWALADNGYAWRENSADFQLVIYRFDPRWGDSAGPQVVSSIVMRDPDQHIAWVIVCDQMRGARLPDFSFNVLPPPPAACGNDPSARILTGFDLDPESFVRAPDGTFWIGEEFGPFFVHIAADGRVLEPPIGIDGVRSPQNPHLSLSARAAAETPTLAASRGFEGVAISPDGSRLYGLLEGPVAGDDPRDLRIYVYDVGRRVFPEQFRRLRLEMPGQLVNLASLTNRNGARVYPGTVAPPAGPVSIGEIKSVNDRHLLLIERDNHGDDVPPPRFKKIFLLDISEAASRDGYVGKAPLVDLLAIPDPLGLGGDGDFFRLPFYTIESVHVVDDRTILVASDNNYPFSSGRSRDRNLNRGGPLAADETEFILIRLGASLDVDRRLLPGGALPSPR